jgi:[ribosomal protein S18]-alanine N-acetyltransferase
VVIRDAQADDLPFLTEMLYEAAFPPGVPRPDRDEALVDPRLARWLVGWGRRGDLGVVAVDGSRRRGAAWCRLFDDAEVRQRGLIDEKTPELVIAVEPDSRGRGIGGEMLGVLLQRAKDAGFAGISLGVGETNPAVQLYRRHGFRELDDGRKRWTMYRKLT